MFVSDEERREAPSNGRAGLSMWQGSGNLRKGDNLVTRVGKDLEPSCVEIIYECFSGEEP